MDSKRLSAVAVVSHLSRPSTANDPCPILGRYSAWSASWSLRRRRRARSANEIQTLLDQVSAEGSPGQEVGVEAVKPDLATANTRYWGAISPGCHKPVHPRAAREKAFRRGHSRAAIAAA